MLAVCPRERIDLAAPDARPTLVDGVHRARKVTDVTAHILFVPVAIVFFRVGHLRLSAKPPSAASTLLADAANKQINKCRNERSHDSLASRKCYAARKCILPAAAFDFRPGMIGKNLDLKRGGNKRYQTTAAYGHFGRDEDLNIFTWEKVVPL